MLKDLEPLFIILVGLSFCFWSMRHVDKELNNDAQRAINEKDRDYHRMEHEAEKYGFEGSRLQRYIGSKQEK